MKRLRQLRPWAPVACVVWVCGSAQVHAAPAPAAGPPPAVPTTTGDAAGPAATEQQRMAGELSKAARTHYKAGRYAEAVAAFERALDLYPNPTLLFNLAQAHRHNGSAENAIFYFKRYLVMVPRAPDRADVEMRIHYLEQASKTGAPANQASTAATAPPAVATGANGASTPAGPSGAPAPPPGPPGALVAASGADSSDRAIVAGSTTPTNPPGGSVPARPLPPEPDLPTAESDRLQEFEPEALVTEDAESALPKLRRGMRLLAHAGLAVPHFGGVHPEANSDLLYAFAGIVSVSYSMPVEFGSVDFGLASSYSPAAYRNTKTRDSVLSHLIGGFATGGLRFSVGDSFSFGPSLALGVVWWSGIGDDNFFTSSTKGTDGAAAMPSARVGLPLLWRLGPSFLIGVEPAWAFSKVTNVDLSAKTPDLSWFSLSGVLGFAL
jgi:tetratricopeptide (TPR) repeat protein